MIILICRHHGPLTEENVKWKPFNGKLYPRCKSCIKAQKRRHYLRHAKGLIEVSKYTNRITADVVRDARNKDSRNRNKHSRKILDDWYVKKFLLKKYDNTEITPEMIELKRAIILLRRKIKTMTNDDNR
jgi:ribosomal protein L20